MRDLVLESWDDVAAWLRERRAAVGNPTYADLATRVREQRVARGIPADEARVARATVFDCFKDGRRRMDLDLLTELGMALGLRGEDARLWRTACGGVQGRLEASRVVAVSEQVPQTPHFVARQHELDALCDKPGTWVISGMTGVGKSQLALRAAQTWLHAGRATRTLVADLRGHHAVRTPADGEAMLEELLRVLTQGPVAPASASHRRERLAALLAEHRVVLVLDDAASQAQVDAVVPTATTTPVLVTSRQPLDLAAGSQLLALDVLGTDEALELLARVAGEERVRADEPSASQIATILGGLPLALDVTAQRIAAHPDWDLAEHREALAHQTSLLRLPAPVSPALSLSYRRLSPPARRGLRLIADQPVTSLGLPALAALLDLDEPETHRVVAELTTASLAAYDTRVRLHDLVRVFALGESLNDDRPTDRDQARGRLLDHYLAAAGTAVVASGLQPMVSRQDFDPTDFDPTDPEPADSGPTAEEASAWLRAERENLLTLANAHHSAARPEFASRLSSCLVRMLDVQGWFTDGLHLHTLALEQARRSDDRATRARSEAFLSQTHHRLGRTDEAVASATRALDLVDTATDPDTAASAASSLGIVAWLKGDFTDAGRWFTQALDVVQTHDATRSPSGLLGNLGAVAVELGDLDLGASRHLQAYETAEAEGNLQVAATALLNLGNLESFTGKHEEAERSARRACEIAESLGAHTVLSPARVNLGSALTHLDQHAEARDVLTTVLAESCERSDPLHETAALLALADLDLAVGDLPAARAGAETAADRAEANGLVFWQARQREAMGRISLAEDDPATAREHFEAALAVFEEIGSPYAAKVREHLDAG